VILDANGKPVLGADGMPLIANGAMSDPRIPPGGSIGAGGVILDANGKPVLGADGKPLIATSAMSGGDPRIPPGGSVGAGGVILDANGKPVLGADGKPLIVIDPRVPPGGSIGEGGVILDANGKPVLGADGMPLIAGGAGADGDDDPRIPPGGSIGDGGIILDANGKPVLGADGKPQFVTDPRVPPGGSIRAPGIILDKHGNPVLGPDGQPLMVGKGKGKKKRAKETEVVPAGRVVTIKNCKTRNLPDTDLRGTEKNIADPYLIFSLLDANGTKIDEAKTTHRDNVRKCHWHGEVLKLFANDNKDGSPTDVSHPVSVLVQLMDYNKKSADYLIGELTMTLKVGKGRKVTEVPSRCVSSARPYIYFEYEVTPNLFFEQTEIVRVATISDDNDEDTEGSEGYDSGTEPGGHEGTD